MDEEKKTILVNRFKSFAWRLGAYVVVSLIGFVVDNLGVLDLNPQFVTIIALVLGEITKLIQANIKLGKARRGLLP